MTHRDKKEIDYYFSYMIYNTIYVKEIKMLKHLIKNVVIKRGWLKIDGPLN